MEWSLFCQWWKYVSPAYLTKLKSLILFQKTIMDKKIQNPENFQIISPRYDCLVKIKCNDIFCATVAFEYIVKPPGCRGVVCACTSRGCRTPGRRSACSACAAGTQPQTWGTSCHSPPQSGNLLYLWCKIVASCHFHQFRGFLVIPLQRVEIYFRCDVNWYLILPQT